MKIGMNAALVRSSLHLGLLQENEPGIDIVLFRDERLAGVIEAAFPGRGLFLGREARLDPHPLRFVRNVRANRQYYRDVRKRVEALGIGRLILFLEGEPLERSILAWYRGKVELWEEGLSHYVDLTTPLWYAARGCVQILAGFYPRGALVRRADRGGMLVRDRFAARNLTLASPVLAAPEEQVLVIGSPLVEDRLISRAVWTRGLAAIAGVSPWPVRYLPHPREDKAALPALLASIVGEGGAGVTLAPEPHGIAPHAQAHGYRAFLAPVSTALLDLGAFGASLFVADLFGQRRISRVLRGWADNPVDVAADEAALRAFFAERAGD
ncbi:hypothetical protein NUTIK01_16920 [Novosphingobium sp. IK01]|uniref:Glycosyltransferase family 1 protein n=2 Tax=Novosphingobium pituita TaxID=3056842 RepID=A0ABQ6P759_9SPHN|nr:hypothetical protein NUTIK01_16920 [Novosphingobium sp. IK01]